MTAMLPMRRNSTEIGTLVRLLREKRGLTQLQLAARAGVTDTTVRSVERASKTPHRATLAAIAAALGTTTKKLMGGTTEAEPDGVMQTLDDDTFLGWDELT
jgi:transcriptional regulator with XRE-family HTH domain